MNHVQFHPQPSAFRPPLHTGHMASLREEEGPRLPCDRDFIEMLGAYRATGGIARGDQLLHMLQERGLDLEPLLGTGEIFGFDWHQRFWVPMFQFERPQLVVKGAHRRVLAELGDVFDGWGLALWFSQPNSWLNDSKPVDLLESDLGAVLKAARADRFVARG